MTNSNVIKCFIYSIFIVYFQYMLSFLDSWTQLVSRSFHLKYIPPDCSNDSPVWSVSHLCRHHWYQDKEIGAEPNPLIDTCCFSFAIISFSLWITLFADYELKIFLCSHFTFLSADFHMLDSSFLGCSARNIFARTAKDYTKITNKML